MEINDSQESDQAIGDDQSSSANATSGEASVPHRWASKLQNGEVLTKLVHLHSVNGLSYDENTAFSLCALYETHPRILTLETYFKRDEI